MPVEWGAYRLEVTSADANGPATSVTFYAGWYGGQSADSPEVLEVSLDKASYQAGETAKLRIVPNGAGKAMIAVMREGLLSTSEVDVPEGGATIDVPVDAAMAPGAYVTATLYRPMDVAAKRMPSRSIGVIWMKTETAEKSLAVSLDLPEKVPSGATLEVPVTLAGLSAGEEAYVTVAAVDVGILNLTAYKAPAPEDWYLRPAPPRHRDPRSLRPPHRRHARRSGFAPLWRRRHGARSRRQSAERNGRGAVLRHPEGRRRRQDHRQHAAARVQRLGQSHGGRLDPRQARSCREGGHRPRSRSRCSSPVRAS